MFAQALWKPRTAKAFFMEKSMKFIGELYVWRVYDRYRVCTNTFVFTAAVTFARVKVEILKWNYGFLLGNSAASRYCK
jgi:hypothetical protein